MTPDFAMAEHMLRQYAEDCVEDGTISDEIKTVIASMQRATKKNAPHARIKMLNRVLRHLLRAYDDLIAHEEMLSKLPLHIKRPRSKALDKPVPLLLRCVADGVEEARLDEAEDAAVLVHEQCPP